MAYSGLLRGCAAAALCVVASAGLAQEAPIIQPGAPGQASRALNAADAVRIADTRFSPADVQFMQHMIAHHRQAVEMAALVQGRSTRAPLIAIAKRIDASQADEITFMQTWLRERGVRAEAAGHGAMADHAGMPGMATAEQLARLRASKGAAFDRLFLELMIAHHEGAIEMVETLLDRPGSAYDPVLFKFTSDVTNEQQAESERMGALQVALSDDPRSGLAAGFGDAGQSIRHLALVAALPKPAGFFDKANPGGMPPAIPADPAAARAEGEPDAARAAADVDNEEDGKTKFSERSPLLDFAQTDMAFSGDLLAVGNYHGFNLYRLDAQGMPRLASSVVCPGGQGDVSIVGDILIMSVEQTRARVDCGLQGVNADNSPERFRGLRIFDISDPVRPRQVGQVQTCRGSHTHSVVSDPQAKDAIIVYNSGTAGIRDGDELAGCVDAQAGDDRTALFRIDVIEIPLSDPSRARIIDSPAVFVDSETGALAGLWRGGDHGDGTQETNRTDHCHDITVFPSRKLAAGACSGNGVIFDISDPRKPHRIDSVVDDGFAYWHSATFNNDGTKVLFTDEWGGGSRPRCRAQDPRDWGANAIYDIVDGELAFRSHYKLPAVQTEMENCVAHNGSVVPVPGRDIFVQAWYQGGVSVMDFTDSAKPIEIAYFDRGPVSDETLVMGGYWSTYWYNGKIYGSEIARGLDVLALQPSQHLTANEIAAATMAEQGGAFNPQQQFPVTWPDHPVVALAYLDQLQRGRALAPAIATDLTDALSQAKARVDAQGKDPALASRIASLAGQVTGRAGSREAALGKTLRGIAATLR